MHDMEDALEALENRDGDLSCLLIRGSEIVFSTGLDAGLLETCFKDRAYFSSVVARMSEVCERMVHLPQITIACVDGVCRLGGLELALACDLIIAGPSARISDGHLAYDAMPGAGATKRLPARVGYSQSLIFLLESPELDAGSASELGLVDEWVQSGSAFERAKVIAGKVVAHDAGLMRDLKQSLRAACPAPDDKTYLKAFQRSVIDRLVSG